MPLDFLNSGFQISRFSRDFAVKNPTWAILHHSASTFTALPSRIER